jgi:hypothetical protein
VSKVSVGALTQGHAREFFRDVHRSVKCRRSIPAGSILLFRTIARALSLRLVHSGTSIADAPKLAYGLLYRSAGRQAETLAYIDIFLVLTMAASIMFVLSFIVRRNDPKAGGGVAVG